MGSNFNKSYVTWKEVEEGVFDIVDQLREWKPDVIFGLSNGGVVPATLIAKYYNVPVRTVVIQLRDGIIEDLGSFRSSLWEEYANMNVLVVDDINDTGSTFNTLLGNIDHYPTTIKTAVLHSNIGSKFTVDVTSVVLDKEFDDVWIVYPWESFLE